MLQASPAELHASWSVCVWGAQTCTHVDMRAHIRATECCVDHILMLTSGNCDRFKYL